MNPPKHKAKEGNTWLVNANLITIRYHFNFKQFKTISGANKYVLIRKFYVGLRRILNLKNK